jgi:hypothetical protein
MKFGIEALYRKSSGKRQFNLYSKRTVVRCHFFL